MTVDFDNELRDALGEIADEARPVTPALAQTALRTGRRRHAARLSLTAVAAAAVAAVLTPTLVLGHRAAPAGPTTGTTPSSTPPTTSPPTPPPSTPPAATDIDGWILAGGPTKGGVLVWSRAQQRYVTLHVDHAWPAPSGDLVITEVGSSMTLRSIGGGKVTTLPGGDAAQINWNAEGTRALYSLLSADRPKAVIVDAVHRTAHTLDLRNQCDGAHCVGASWLTGTDHFTATVDNGSPGNLTVFDTNGNTLDTITGKALSGTDVSADRRYIVEDQIVGGVIHTAVRDRSTGTVALLDDQNLDLRTVRWMDATHFIAITDGQLVEFGVDGHRVATTNWPHGFIEDELPNFTLFKS